MGALKSRSIKDTEKESSILVYLLDTQYNQVQPDRPG